jgi:serine/threonine protein kinase
LHDEADAANVLLHRDLKPDNVGFLADGSLQLFDFGLATSVPRQKGPPAAECGEGGGGLGAGAVLPRYRMTGHTGSVRYMAPEVATDLPYNQAVDTYSFAMILWCAPATARSSMPFLKKRARSCHNLPCSAPRVASEAVSSPLALVCRAQGDGAPQEAVFGHGRGDAPHRRVRARRAAAARQKTRAG